MRFFKKVVDYMFVITCVLVITFLGKSSFYARQAKKLLSHTVGMVQFERGGATGFVVRLPNGEQKFLTNQHVCEGAGSNILPVILPGEKHTEKMLIEEADRGVDLCVAVHERVTNWPYAIELASEMPKKFDHISIAGHPFLQPLTFVEGYVVEIDKAKLLIPPSIMGTCPPGTLQLDIPNPFGLPMPACELTLREALTTAEIYPGNSGSPVINDSNKLVGVVNLSDRRTARGSIVPIDDVRKFLLGDKLEEVKTK